MENKSHDPRELMEREQIEVTPETIRPLTRKLFDGIMRIYYYALRSNQLIEKCMTDSHKAGEPVDTEAAYKMYLEIQNEFNELRLKVRDLYNAGSWSYDRLGIPYSRYVKALNHTQSVLESAIFFGEKALEVQAQEGKSDKDYYTILKNNTKKMNDRNKDAFLHVREWENIDEDQLVIFETGMNDFAISTKNIREFVEDFKKKSNNNTQIVNSVEGKIMPAAGINSKEQARLAAIDRANFMYQEFCEDFLRDLQAQYALSTKDLYEDFVNVKFKKFKDKFPMPISSDASEGYANEVINQIQILINYVSKISENSYTTSTFGDN